MKSLRRGLGRQQRASEVYMHPDVASYLVALIQATRAHPMLLRGASPRATLSVSAMARAMALLCGRDYVLPDDIQTVLPNTVTHRLLLSPDRFWSRCSSKLPRRD